MAARKLIPLWPLALGFGILAGWVYIHAPTGLAALLVVAFSMGMGVARPRQPWVWALLIALWIPAAEAWLIVRHIHPTIAGLPGALLVLFPGFVGAYGGFFMRKAIGVLFPEPQPSEKDKKTDSSASSVSSAPPR